MAGSGRNDEGVLKAPDSWRKTMYLRRGGWFTQGRAAVIDASAAAAQTAELVRPARTRVPEQWPDEIAAALKTPGQATPRAVAALLAAVGLHRPKKRFWQAAPDPRLADAADHWAGLRGLPFVAEVAVELAGLDALPPDGRPRAAGADPVWVDEPVLPFTARVRNRLAVAPEAEYAEAQARLTAYRGPGLGNVVTTFLLPTRTDWVERDLASPLDRRAALLVLASVRTREQLTAAMAQVDGRAVLSSPALVMTLLDGLGLEVAPDLAGWLREFYGDDDVVRSLYGIATWVPHDDMFRALLHRSYQKSAATALRAAVNRYPRRAMRVAAQQESRSAAELLRGHAARHRDLAEEVLTELDEAAAARLRTVLETFSDLPDAPPERLHPVLVSPPWVAPELAAKRPHVPVLASPARAAAHWMPGEREAFAATLDVSDVDSDVDMEQLARSVKATRWHRDEHTVYFLAGPWEEARAALPGWSPHDLRGVETWLRGLLARFGTDALRHAVSLAARNPAAAPALLPFTGLDVTIQMTTWLGQDGTPAQGTAREWLERHAETAVGELIPMLFRHHERGARRALRWMIQAGHGELVDRAAAGYGPTIPDAVRAMLALDTVMVAPPVVPKLPAWLDVESLPRIRLRDGAAVLPVDSARHLLTLLAIDGSHGGVRVAYDLLDPDDLRAFHWELFGRWVGNGCPARGEDWPLTTMWLTGDDASVRRLSTVIQAWPGHSGHARALVGLRVLERFQSHAALTELHRIATKCQYRGLREAAARTVGDLAARMGLSAEQLADRLVPDLGLAADGTMRLDYGTRTFVVGFDEQLKPYVSDETGKRLRALPRPGTPVAETAHKRFTALKKEARALASEQLKRLEQAMLNGRRWSAAEFRTLFIGHPLLWHVARHLVWGVYERGTLAWTFRPAEDRGLADVHDDQVTLPSDAVIGVPHPLELADALATWSEIFDDYALGQPFPQLGRETFGFGPEGFAEFTHREVPSGPVLGLERRGWQRDRAESGGWQRHLRRTIAEHEVWMELDPGFQVGYGTSLAGETQKLGSIGVYAASGPWSPRRRVPEDAMDPVVASEVLRDLRSLF